MRIAKVVGTVTLAKSHPNLATPRLRLVRPLETEAEIAAGEPQPERDIICAYDFFGAGIGDTVALAEGPEAANPFRPQTVPIDASIAALLDAIDL